MGGCMGVAPGRQLRDTFDIEPKDTQTMNPANCPPLSFKALLTKLKLKWCSHYVKTIPLLRNSSAFA